MGKFDYLVVGSGLSGAILAHQAKVHGKSVLVVDKRPNIAGNVYTENVEGINVHKYGAHIFHTNNVIDGQLCFNFNEAEALLENIYVVEPVEEDVIPTVVKRKKTRGKRKEDLSRLPVEMISHTLSEEELTDIFGPDGWKQLPDETYMRVKVEPARYTVEEHHVCVYAGKTTDKIVKAFRPKSLLRNSIATPSLVASIMNAKYVNGMPLDRIATDFRRNEVNISKQVMANWVIRCSERYLSPVYFRLHELLLKYNVIQQDETPVEVSKDGRPANSKSYMWVYRSGKYYTDRVIILYEYQKTRKAEHPQRFLEGFHGVCECDAYTDYGFLDDLLPWSESIPDICKIQSKK